jgi:hypothetical protein
MQLYYTERFRRSYADAPLRVKKQCDKQLGLLAQASAAHRCEPRSTTRRRTSIFGMEFWEVGTSVPTFNVALRWALQAAEKLNTLSF